jgi:hypothetical protein
VRAFIPAVVLLAACRPSSSSSLSAAEIYSRIAPSIAHLSAGLSGGSGVLLEGGVVLTNAHVVWPHERIRVTFAPHLEFVDVPVKAVDVDGDLALVGPLTETGRRPLRVVSPDGLPIGSEVFLLGYPGEVEKFPEPAITRGILSRVRESGFENLTFLQSDATIVGGQSGGALVSSNGDVIGISGLIGIEQFALVLSGADVLARIPNITSAPSPLARSLKGPPPGMKQSARFEPAKTQAAWFFQANDGDHVTIESDDALLEVFDADLTQNEQLGDGTYRFDISGPHVVVANFDEAEQAVVESDRELTPFVDPDDGRAITVGTDVHGVIDYPKDEDRYLLELEAGQRVYVRVDGVLDALCSVFEEDGVEELVGARVAEGGLGMSADLNFEAPRSGRFVISVAEANPEGPAGYRLTVTPSERSARSLRRLTSDGGVRRLPSP